MSKERKVGKDEDITIELCVASTRVGAKKSNVGKTFYCPVARNHVGLKKLPDGRIVCEWDDCDNNEYQAPPKKLDWLAI